jgi:hypothetical protein
LQFFDEVGGGFNENGGFAMKFDEAWQEDGAVAGPEFTSAAWLRFGCRAATESDVELEWG